MVAALIVVRLTARKNSFQAKMKQMRAAAARPGLMIGRITERSCLSSPPPGAEERRINPGKLALALALEGALFRAVKGLVDHASREGFARVTGIWPGEKEQAQPESA